MQRIPIDILFDQSFLCVYHKRRYRTEGANNIRIREVASNLLQSYDKNRQNV